MSNPLAAIDLGISQGAAVLNLLERAKVPPVPVFYGLLYDYVAGASGMTASRLDSILTAGDSAEGTVGERLYAEFVAPYENTETIERAVDRMVTRLAALDVLVVASSDASEAQSASLRAADSQLASGKLDAGLLRDWVQRLDAANQRMRKANSALLHELNEAEAELEITRVELARSKDSARRDPVTFLVNRAGLDEELAQILHNQRVDGSDLCCAVVDIDNFKTLNDTYGHPVGDEVLRLVSRALLSSARHTDILGRTGGDEFVLIFPRTDMNTAKVLADRMRRAISQSDLRGALGEDVLGNVTASIGVAPFMANDDISTFVHRADRALYRAKEMGRNRVACYGESGG